ncbi:hypothetical protein DWS25_20300 [Escherichia coli]|nr:hypothetical protein [Escherichia coli]HDV3419776.1 hypothetical protein [Escherichia coli]HDX5578625.1 hypothetical protein [Escherichia coli]
MKFNKRTGWTSEENKIILESTGYATTLVGPGPAAARRRWSRRPERKGGGGLWTRHFDTPLAFSMVLHATFLFFAPMSLRIAHALHAQCASLSGATIATLYMSGAYCAIITRATITHRGHLRIACTTDLVGYSRRAQLLRNAQPRTAGNLRYSSVSFYLFLLLQHLP